MNTNTPLLTDQYQLMMAYGYWQAGKSEQEAVFQLSFPNNPQNSNYAICCGLDNIISFLQDFKFKLADIKYLKTLIDSNEFLAYLQQLKFTCSIDAVAEGTLVFAKEPVLIIRGPLLQCQILETVLTNMLGFATLVATKASKICQIAQDKPVIEFGLRRAQGPNGGLIASRAAFIGGCEATSNVLAGKAFGIPVCGTMSHNWVMSFANELEAFRAFADIMRSDTVLLLDTYNPMHGIKNALVIGQELRRRKHDLYGVKLACGNLAKLSKKIRKILDKAGFTNTKIIVSGMLDEATIKKLQNQKAMIDIWEVGTKLVTSYDQPAIDMTYKLMSIQNLDTNSPMPDIQQVRRFYQDHKPIKDIVYDTELNITEPKLQYDSHQDLLIPIFRDGELLYQQPDIKDIKAHAYNEIKQFVNTKKYDVVIDKKLLELQQ